MKQTKTIAEYKSQLNRVRAWVDGIRSPRRVVTAIYKSDDIDKSSFKIDTLRERIITAQLLGWDTEVVVGDDGSLSVQHILRSTSPPPNI